MVLNWFRGNENYRRSINNSISLSSLENLNHNNPKNRRKAALAIAKNRNSEALFPLLNTYFHGSSYLIPRIIGKIGKNHTKLLLKIALNNKNKARVRCYAIEGLGKIKDKSTLNSLHLLLKDNDVYIRRSVILALADIGDKTSVQILLELLEREDDWIKLFIIWALGVIGDFRCVDKLIEMLSKKKLKFIIKKNTINALGRIGDKRALDILIEILKDQHSGLEDYVVFALEKIGDRRELLASIKEYLNPIWFFKEHHVSIMNKLLPHWRRLLKDHEFKIFRREELPAKIFENIDKHVDWYYGYLNKSHYILNNQNEIIGCLNILYLINYNKIYLFYMDTLEIRKDYRRQKLGTKLVNFVIEQEIKKNYDKFNVFLLIAKCEQHKLNFFTTLGFMLIKLRKTGVGSHCIMSYPFDENSEKNCQRLFEYFSWREEKKKFISSDCKFAYNPNTTGLYWCAKKKIYVTGLEKQNCPFYVKEKEIISDKKFLDLKELFD